jgi:release factor glutamine methyltransferase
VRPDPTMSIEVAEGVYAPSEDTFLLLSAVQVKENERVLELGTGTGIIALHCAKAGALVVATDISLAAVRNARSNARANGIQMDIIRADMTMGLVGCFDALIFNPPYLGNERSWALSQEERAQLVGGARGSEASIRFLKDARRLLTEDGRIYQLVSSESAEWVLRFSDRGFHYTSVAERDLFFERLAVYELRPR